MMSMRRIAGRTLAATTIASKCDEEYVGDLLDVVSAALRLPETGGLPTRRV